MAPTAATIVESENKYLMLIYQNFILKKKRFELAAFRTIHFLFNL
jgi:hypothetical protein